MQTYPSSTWIQDISPLKNFKRYMQTEGKNKKSQKLNKKLDPANPVATSSKDCTEVRGITSSSDDNNWPQVAHASLLQLRPSGGNSALPKITSTKPGGQEVPCTHTPHSQHFTKCAKLWSANLKWIFHVWGFICWQKTQRQGHAQDSSRASLQNLCPFLSVEYR